MPFQKIGEKDMVQYEGQFLPRLPPPWMKAVWKSLSEPLSGEAKYLDTPANLIKLD